MKRVLARVKNMFVKFYIKNDHMLSILFLYYILYPQTARKNVTSMASSKRQLG